MADYNYGIYFENEDTEAVFSGRPQRLLSDSIQTILRDYICKANIKGVYITLEILCRYFAEAAPEQKFSVRTLGRALDRWGFTFGKGVRTQRFKEKDHVVAARQRYLRRKIASRKAAGTVRPEVYSDESYVNKNHKYIRRRLVELFSKSIKSLLNADQITSENENIALTPCYCSIFARKIYF